MKILIACEESQIVTTAFRNKGHEAYSCDILPTSGKHPEWHLQDDVRDILSQHWDMIIAFPPCTDLAGSGARWFPAKRENGSQTQAIAFFKLFVNHTCPRIAIENPVGIMSTFYKKPSQYIHPWQHGHKETKKTCLWLKGLPVLQNTNVVGPPPKKMTMEEKREWNKVHRCPPGPDRAKIRSKTYSGIAAAMAEQWG